eukprot:6939410-Pyramimonas_sp.AAC.1
MLLLFCHLGDQEGGGGRVPHGAGEGRRRGRHRAGGDGVCEAQGPDGPAPAAAERGDLHGGGLLWAGAGGPPAARRREGDAAHHAAGRHREGGRRHRPPRLPHGRVSGVLSASLPLLLLAQEDPLSAATLKARRLVGHDPSTVDPLFERLKHAPLGPLFSPCGGGVHVTQKRFKEVRDLATHPPEPWAGNPGWGYQGTRLTTVGYLPQLTGRGTRAPPLAG